MFRLSRTHELNAKWLRHEASRPRVRGDVLCFDRAIRTNCIHKLVATRRGSASSVEIARRCLCLIERYARTPYSSMHSIVYSV